MLFQTEQRITKGRPLQDLRILRLPEVLHLVGVSKSTWGRGIDLGYYPEAVGRSIRSVGWYEFEIRMVLENPLNDEELNMLKAPDSPQH